MDAEKSLVDKVRTGLDGWLFLTTGTNHVLRYYTEPDYFSDILAFSWAQLIATRERRMGLLGADYTHLFVPDKLTIYPEYFGAELPYFHRHPIALIDRHLHPYAGHCWLNLVPVLQAAKPHGHLFYKTDSHWTFFGCHTAYLAICRRFGAQPNPQLPNLSGKAVLRSGDLGEKLTPAPQERMLDYNLLTHAKRVHTNRLVQFYEKVGFPKRRSPQVGANAVYRNEAALDPRTLVLFGDSFSHFSPMLLTAMLAETFREVHFCWSFMVDADYVKAVKANIVVSELAERFAVADIDDTKNILKVGDIMLDSFLQENPDLAAEWSAMAKQAII